MGSGESPRGASVIDHLRRAAPIESIFRAARLVLLLLDLKMFSVQGPPLAGQEGAKPAADAALGDSFRVGAPQISLPKGGGAIRGIGEKFAANPVTGTGSLTVPIHASPGRSGFGPQLSLSYDSGAGNGPFGFGWSLALPSITRKTDKGLPRYDDAGISDTFTVFRSKRPVQRTRQPSCGLGPVRS
jgi:hypothetical protein